MSAKTAILRWAAGVGRHQREKAEDLEGRNPAVRGHALGRFVMSRCHKPGSWTDARHQQCKQSRPANWADVGCRLDCDIGIGSWELRCGRRRAGHQSANRRGTAVELCSSVAEAKTREQSAERPGPMAAEWPGTEPPVGP